MTTQDRRRIVTVVVAGLTALLLTAAFAQPNIDLSATTVRAGTVGSFVDSHAAGGSATLCYQVGVAHAGASYACFEHAVRLSGMGSRLTGSQPVTVFAPTDVAFAHLESTLGMGAFQRFMRSPSAMKQLVDAVVVPGGATLSDLAYRASPTSPSTSLTTVAGMPLDIAFGAVGYATSSTSVDVGPSSAVDGQSYVSGAPSVFAGGSVLIPLGRIPLASLGD